MKPDTTKKGLIRGALVWATDNPGCIGINQAKDENNLHVGVAYTPWHRHDEDPEIVERELASLHRVYASFQNWSGGLMWYEYRSYSK